MSDFKPSPSGYDNHEYAYEPDEVSLDRLDPDPRVERRYGLLALAGLATFAVLMGVVWVAHELGWGR